MYRSLSNVRLLRDVDDRYFVWPHFGGRWCNGIQEKEERPQLSHGSRVSNFSCSIVLNLCGFRNMPVGAPNCLRLLASCVLLPKKHVSRVHRSGLAAALPILSESQKHAWNYVLFAAMGYRAYKSGKFMPAGMVALLAAGMIALRTFQG